jgi:hypothetical protein
LKIFSPETSLLPVSKSSGKSKNPRNTRRLPRELLLLFSLVLYIFIKYKIFMMMVTTSTAADQQPLAEFVAAVAARVADVLRLQENQVF